MLLKNFEGEVTSVKIIDRFEIPYYQYMSPESEVNDLPAEAKDISELVKLYRLMVLVRVMDTKAIALQRTGKLGTYPSTRGQEAVFVGMGSALEKKDVFVPYYRDMGTLIQRGVKLSQILLYWGGDERGNCFADSNDFPFSVPVGSQPLHAVGAGYAIKYRKEKRAVMVSCGDGATSQGDFYEAMNVAGIWKLPVVFAVCNNQWAISVSRDVQTAAHTLAQKAIAAGIHGEQIDGNDIVTVQHRLREALKNARENHQPSLIEMVCYRQHDHTTADDASRYEGVEIRPQEWKKEPITRLKKYLEAQGAWDQTQEEELQKACSADVDEAVKEYLAISRQPIPSMMEHLYAELPHALTPQWDMLNEMELNNG